MNNLKFDLSFIVCPLCKNDLAPADDKYICGSCNLNFPVIKNNIIPLFKDTGFEISQSYEFLKIASSKLERQSLKLKALTNEKNIIDNCKLLRLTDALNDNSVCLKKWANILDQHVSRELLQKLTNVPVTMYGYTFSYLYRDWAVELDEKVSIILQQLHNFLHQFNASGNACMLGMGTGRISLEITNHFTMMYGIDSSFGQIIQFHELTTNDIEFWNIKSKNQLSSKNVIEKAVASIPDRLKLRLNSIEYLWSDALSLPFRENSFNWVLSIYFSDVKPLPLLMPEIKRILKPGGYFLHYGPLEYHFNEIQYHYSLDEFIEYFVSKGFQLLCCERMPIKKFDSDDYMDTMVINKQFIDQLLVFRFDPTE